MLNLKNKRQAEKQAMELELEEKCKQWAEEVPFDPTSIEENINQTVQELLDDLFDKITSENTDTIPEEGSFDELNRPLNDDLTIAVQYSDAKYIILIFISFKINDIFKIFDLFLYIEG